MLAAILLALSSLAPSGNQPPNACFSASPPQGTVQTNFSFNAGCSTDDHTAGSKLQVRWDWDYPSGWDTPLSTTKTASHSYTVEGNHTVGLLVQDQQGATGTTTKIVLVAPQLTESTFGVPQAWEPDIDVNPLTPSHQIVSGINSPSSAQGMIAYPAFYSTDSGQTWTQSTGIGPNDEVGDPSIEYDADGRAFYMEVVPFPANAGATPVGVYVARSDDDGMTYPARTYPFDMSSTFTLPGGGTTHSCVSSGLPYDYPKLGVDKSAGSSFRNTVYATAEADLDQNGDGTCGSASMVFARSTDHGLTWTSRQVLDGNFVNVNRIAVTANGTILLARGINPGDPRCASGNGIVLRTSTDGGATFTSGTCIYNSNGDIFPSHVWPVAHATDASRIWVAFDAAVNSLASIHVFVIKSTDGGGTWSSPLRVDDAILDDHVDHFMPTLALSSSGRLDMSWFDYRNSSPTVQVPGAWQPSDIYHSFSLDGGFVWAGSAWGTTNVRLSPVTGTTFHGGGNDYLTAVSSGNKTYVAYGQDRQGNHLIDGFVAALTYH
jgi:hypothetical protein